MALVDELEKIKLEKNSPHSSVHCSYSIVVEDNGDICLQIDTYGSENRKIQGKKSQSIRFSPQAIQQLKQIIEGELHY